MLPYRYLLLKHDDAIRVLVLHPSLNSSDPLICTIRQARLSDASLEYEAVSYTWGDIAQKRAIYFYDGARELLVGENCHSVLWHLRRRHGVRLLWIDAVCINQENLGERDRQVRIMDEVFKRAFNVTVFLGEQTTGSRVLFEELAAADRALSLGEDCNRPSPNDAIVQELEALFRRPWFKRVWVLQEVCAKSFGTMMCGSASASFDALKHLYFGYSQNWRVTKSCWPLALEWIYRPPEELSTPQFTLWNRLYESRKCLATDPRDKVFALKSLIGSAQSEMDYLINYVQTLEQCYFEIAGFLLPVIGLRILTAIRHPHEMDMPSWIPDWSQNLPLNLYYFVVESLGAAVGQPAPRLKPHNDQKHEIRSFPGGENEKSFELLVTGCRYAQIVDRSRIFWFDSTNDAENQVKGLYYSIVSLRRFVDTEGIRDDRTMSDHLGKRIQDVMSLIDGHQLNMHLTRWCGRIMHDDDDFIDTELVGHLVESLQQCRIILMDNGELAIVPGNVRYGDVVCILSGTDSACTLRPDRNGNWTLVSGDCYILTESFKFPNYGWFLCDDHFLLQEFASGGPIVVQVQYA
ncbi:hypothetical protein K458DRAFT_430202 [Lentithecium fluviatile CBS 122367]|uniref:Heterokaryon incompatibility domain-containing protein n=1 Tax=Lentithecium fluviatile CBS 122367 TaxID=1168545 RepID=A0A6G1J827_9PLEO|nr:hypothetical protein K458DRAFT_430202 [Lentithecium fluviatile CBS 122367]